MQQNPSPDRHPILNRRQLLSTAIGTAAITAAFPGLATAASDDDIHTLTDDQLEELETIVSGAFGHDQPLPLGITIDEPEDDQWDIPLFNAFALGSNETAETDADITVVDCANALCIDQFLEVVDDVGKAAEEVASVRNDFTRQSFRAQHLLGLLAEQGLVVTRPQHSGQVSWLCCCTSSSKVCS